MTNFLNPDDCLKLSFKQSFEILKNKIGAENLNKALDINYKYPSVISGYKDTSWCKTLKITGINPRITKTFWGIVKYALTFPEEGIHIMPLFKTGDGSLYVQNSWELNDDFLDKDLIQAGYKTAEEQLKLIINILHAMNKIVGFDALAHCDNFSQIVLINPSLFEWVKLNEEKTAQIPYCEIDYNLLYKDVEKIIIETLNLTEDIFEKDEETRKNIIFPKNVNEFQIRMKLRKAIRDKGYEPVPVVEHAPNRPIIFKRIEKNNAESWAVFEVRDKEQSAKIFGAITPYKLYPTDKNGYPEQNNILKDSWEYFANHINDFQQEYNFDFLRADMAHNQIAHSHNNKDKDYGCPELWAYVKKNIHKTKPYFATAAEAFYSTYYIDGISDMINKNFDIVLGNMNFKNLNTDYINFIDDFINPFRKNFNFYPCVTVFTNDGDMESHNIFFKSNKENLARYFISMFLNLPSYTGMGFELRDINPENKNNYSFNYVKKQIQDYSFGTNLEFFGQLTKIRQKYIDMKNIIDNYDLDLIYSLNNDKSLCFEYSGKKISYLIAVNLNETNNIISLENKYKNLNYVFSLEDNVKAEIKENETTIDLNTWEFVIYEYER